MTIHDCAKEVRFIDFINDKVEQVKRDAQALLDRTDSLAAQRQTKDWRQWVRELPERLGWAARRGRDACVLILSAEQIRGMIRDLEHAQRQLHMVLTLTSVNSSTAW